MNKRTLILMCVAFCMLLCVITPFKVSAADDVVDDSEIVTKDSNENLVPSTNDEQGETIVPVVDLVPEQVPKQVPEQVLEQAPDELSIPVPNDVTEGSELPIPNVTQPSEGEITESNTTSDFTVRLAKGSSEEEPKIVIEETTITIYRGNQYVVNYHFENTEEEPKVTLTSSDSSIAAVTNNEIITGKSAGTTTVYLKYTLNDEEYTVELTVKVLPNAQTAKVIISKTDDLGNFLAGATLQILDKNNNNKVVLEWISELEKYEFELPAGNYILHEASAPIGYETAEDQDIDVVIEIEDLNAGVEFDISICSHYKGMPSYYVEIPGTPNEDGTVESEKAEVFCINQEWEVPDDNADYTGTILTPKTISNYTQQTVYTGIGAEDKSKKNISDNSLESQELYDKLLDIIYHKDKARKAMMDQFEYTYTDSELRFVTEAALKNYTNAGITDRKLNVSISGKTEEEKNAFISELEALNIPYELSSDGNKISYLSYRYRDYLYVPETAIGESIVKEDLGNGNSFGQIVAGHWDGRHNGANSQTIKDLVERYYQLYLYLIRDDDHHPVDMNLYVYSTTTSISGNDDYAYQNLLGVTGYYEEYEQEVIEMTVVNTPKTINKTVTKVWADDENESKKRPENITVTLLANGKDYDTIVLSEKNEWHHEFTNLPQYIAGEEIEWTVREENIPEGYVAAYEYDDEKGIIIHNVLGQGGEEPPPENPQTGDNIVLYLITMLISIIGFVSGKKYLKENN